MKANFYYSGFSIYGKIRVETDVEDRYGYFNTIIFSGTSGT
jgi:hypothetical protein